LKKKKFESSSPPEIQTPETHTHTYIMPNLTKMTIRVSAAEWNDLLARLAAAEKKLAAAERGEKSRLARNLKERCRHLLVGKMGSPRRKWYDSATESQRAARIEQIHIELGIKEAPKKCATTGCPNKEYEDGWCEECCADADREGGYDDRGELSDEE